MSSADFSKQTIQRDMIRKTGKLDLRQAESTRVKLTASQQKQIKKLYTDVSKEIAKQAEKAPRVPSDALRKMYLNRLQEQIGQRLKELGETLESTVKENMGKTAEAVVEDNLNFLAKLGMPVEGAFSHVPDEAVKAVATGQLYEGNWTMSRAIWKNTQKTQSDVQTIVAKGIAENKSSYEIAKDLEKYVDPKAAKEWEWSKVYPGTARVVDYNAQRMARTLVSHAYQYTFVQTTKKNPFITKYRWEASNSARVCPICAARDGVEYEKNELPLDHPMGMCTFVAVIPEDSIDIADRIADWAQGKSDSELDTWAKSLGYTSKAK